MSLTREQLISYLENSETISPKEAKLILDNVLNQITEKLYAPEPYDVWLRNFIKIKSQLQQARNTPSFLAKFGVTSTFPDKSDTDNQPLNQSDNSPKI